MNLKRLPFYFSFSFGIFSQSAKAVEIPVDVGLGPSLYSIPDTLQQSPLKPFWGLNLDIKAVINREMIAKYKDKIPQKFRKTLEKTDEVKVGYLFIPSNIMIGIPENSGGPSIYGVSWKPVGVNLPVDLSVAKLSIGSKILLTYAMIKTAGTETNKVTSTTHFIRPGLDLNSELEFMFSDSFLFSAGAAYSFYIPQEMNGSGNKKYSLWRIAEGRATLHYRFPVDVKI
ncbi:MAG: hypothetical protein EBR09_04425 [Proteobacteria bacterium]|nr:hypothetical protein [Pseudomonadota bacterium]